ncbi:heavy-metal-associated domain-containing protein [Massilia genomosp. 1]|uniref:Copper resistance protein CopZ n=1 Tax=Massilia genomosp. 1 TaxID=2609280 RepID=A0ABX0N1M5_9BURK|nr:heavy-metal-associated domain-containing protein [Massilia genomosp. 1]NHZ66568.1 copper resistance protein CopZ [Massilia genomosp. 1]
MQTALLTIPAMQNQTVALAVAQALEAVTGVETVHLTLATGRARVGFDEARASAEQLRDALFGAGFTVAPPASGGCCGGCGGG